MVRQSGITKCLYTDVCYLAEALHCYGYKLDCALYKQSTGQKVTEKDFHDAIDRLIDKAKLENPEVQEEKS